MKERERKVDNFMHTVSFGASESLGMKNEDL